MRKSPCRAGNPLPTVNTTPNSKCSGCNVCNGTARELSVGVNHGTCPVITLHTRAISTR